MKRLIIFLGSVSLILFISGAAGAVLITEGFTFAVANSGGATPGSHFHSNTGGAFGNPAGKAEVGDFFSEEVRGLSEYNLAGLGTSTSAFVTFNVFDDAGLFAGQNDFSFDGDIDVLAYQGNNLEDISDFQAASIGSVGSFNTAGLSVGDVLSFDILDIFNAALASSSLGIRLQVASGTDPDGGAWTFDTFRLTTTDDSTGGPSNPVPEPATLLLLGSGLLGIASMGRKKFFNK